MTTPDHHPYLTEGCLRTMQDCSDFVLVYVIDPDMEWDLSDVHIRLQARLDRERRKACRRGALEAWRQMTRVIREGEPLPMNLDAFTSWSGAWGEEEVEYASERLAEALAFRDAARQP